MRISDWSSDVCSSDLSVLVDQADLGRGDHLVHARPVAGGRAIKRWTCYCRTPRSCYWIPLAGDSRAKGGFDPRADRPGPSPQRRTGPTGARPTLTTFSVLRSEEHTSELQSLMRISYAVFFL